MKKYKKFINLADSADSERLNVCEIIDLLNSGFILGYG